MKTKKVLPAKYKTKIMGFCREYERLSCERKIQVTIPKREAVVRVYWDSDNSISVSDDDVERILDSEDIYKTKEVQKINARIKSFIKKVCNFGKKNFKDRDWMWTAILWDYRPELGETIDIYDCEWVKNYKNE